MNGKILSLFRKGSLLRQMYYGGYEDFDGANGGVWKKYINIPIKTPPSKDAQYLILLDENYVNVYAYGGILKAQSAIASEFWDLIRSDGYDIRVFNQLFNQLYFWVEKFDYANKLCWIWVKIPAYTTEVNIAFGNPVALDSIYKDSSKIVGKWEYGVIDLNKGGEGYPPERDVDLVVLESYASWGGSTWTTDGQWFKEFYNISLTTQDVFVIEFDFVYDIWDYKTNFLDRRQTLFLVRDADENNILEVFRAGTDGNLYAYDGDWSVTDVRDYAEMIATITTGETYRLKITYNEDGNNEWKVYVNGAYKYTATRSTAKNNPPKYWRSNAFHATDGKGAEGDIKYRLLNFYCNVFEDIASFGTPKILEF